MANRPARAFIGTSGWRYREWRGDFYPPSLVQRLELRYLAERVNSAEINGSFYSLQRPSSYERWRDETPDDFVFAVKGGRFRWIPFSACFPHDCGCAVHRSKAR